MRPTICFSTALKSTLLLIAFLPLARGLATTKFVKPTGLDTNNGNTWATAYKTPQKAFDSATAGDTICIATGTYRPAVSPAFLHSGDDRTQTFFIDKDLRLFGGFPATGNPTFADRNPTANPTIFSADNVVNGINRDDLFHVLWIRLLPATSIIDGFTIRDGNASWFDQSEGGSGGGIYNESSIPGTTLVSNPTISNCIFINNRAYRGGALYNDAFGFGGASPTVVNCTFTNNAAFVMGGAIYNEGRFGQAQASPHLINCLFSANSAETGGAITNMGPSGQANPTITNCVFENNNGKFGGAIYNFGLSGNASPIITGCTFRNNSDGGRFGTGGAMIIDGREGGNSNPVIRNCTFSNNVAGSGGGVYVTTAHGGHSTAVVEQCVFDGNRSYGDNTGMWGNDAADGGTITATFTNCGMFNNSAVNRGALFMSASGVATVNLFNCTISGNTSHQGIVFGAPNGTVKNCIFWGNDLLVAGGNPNWVFSHTLLDAPTCPSTISCGTGMVFGQDPLFVNATAGNFHLLPGSPAFNTGTANGAPNTDFEGDARPLYGAPDMGFDEMILPCPTGNILFVDPSATGNGSGNSWPDAFPELAAAVELANQCPNIQEVWVAAGTYLPGQPVGGSTDRHRTFYIERDFKLFGGFAGGETAREQRNWLLHPTVLSGNLGDPGDDSDNAFHVVRIDHCGPDMQIDGFDIVDGNANGSAPAGENLGGGLVNDGSGVGQSSNPTIANCTFSNNLSGRDGGAIANMATGGGTASPTVLHCIFSDNFAALEGGALYSLSSGGTANPTVSNCRFSGNNSTSVGGAVFINGISGSTAPVFESCTFQDNTATFHGGAVFAVGNQTGMLDPSFTNCLFYENGTAGKGGAIAYDDGATGTLHLDHCSFGLNTAPGGGALGIIHWDNGQVPVEMTNCIAFANTSTFGQDNGAGVLNLHHCLIEESSCPPGANCGTGMLFNQNPRFVNLAEGDFHLELNSPAVNAGTTTTNAPIHDLDGNTRPFGSAPDMGCYELQQSPIAADAGPDQSICIDASVVLAAVAVNGTGSWTVTSGPSTASTQFSNTSDANAIFTPAGGDGVYTLRWTVSAPGFPDATDEVVLTLKQRPLAVLTLLPNQVCQGNALNLSVPNAGAGDSYNWSGDGINNTNSNATTAVSAMAGLQVYTVTVTNANGCSATSSTTATVNAQPSATITPNPNPVCQNSTLNLSVPSAGAGAAYHWSGNGINNANANATTAVPTTFGPQTYGVTVTDANGCTNIGSVNTTVNALPSATITATQSSACGPALVNLSVPSAGGGASYNWSGNGVANNNMNATTASPNSAGSQTYRITVTNAQACSNVGVTSIQLNACMEGRILWKQDNTSGVKDVTVALTGDQAASTVTPLNGKFSFNVNSGTSFMITPSKNLNKLNGVNAQDVFRIQQHLNGTAPLTDPYLMVAADVNANNLISALDVNIIQMSLLGNPQALAQFPYSWRFVPTTHTMTNPPWGFPEKITIANVGSGLSNQDFYGIKVGDVATVYANPANSSANPMVFRAQDQFLTAGQAVSVDFAADPLADFTAFQFALRFDSNQLRLSDIQSLTALPLSKDNFGLEQDGLIRVLWAGTDAMALRAPSPVFRLTFTALESGGKLSEVLGLDNSILPAHVYNSANAESDVSLRFFEVTATNDPILTQDHLVLYQNQPNPFSSETSIGFYLPEATKAVFTVYDVNGKLVYRQALNCNKGYNQLTLQDQTLPNAGLFYYRVETATAAATRKMMKVE